MSVKSATIRDYTVVNDKAVAVTAIINLQNHSPLEKVNQQEVLQALSAATGHKMQAIAGTFALRDKGNDRHVVTGFMGLSSGVISIPEGKSVEEATGFQSFSANMFLDDEENLWELSTSGGRNLIRSHTENSMNELETLMASFSSQSFSSLSNYDKQATSAHRADQLQVAGGDMITFMCSESGHVDSALVVAAIDEEQLLCVSSTGAFQIERSEVVASAAEVVASSEIQHPEMVATASFGQTEISKLTDYYTKLYGHNTEYLEKVIGVIKQHAYA